VTAKVKPAEEVIDGSLAADPRARAWRLLFERHASLFARLEAEMRAEQDLSLTWYDVLLHLSEAPRNRLRMNELAEAVVISKSGLTGIVDRMESAGLVAREPVAGDRRAVQVSLTPAGQERFETASQVHRRGIREHFSDRLDEADGEMLMAILKKLAPAS
jgi:DNA-binding MarR family transcriptional regulator